MCICANYLAIAQVQAATKTIVHAKANDPKENLVSNILKLALSKSGSPDTYRFQEYPDGINEARLISLLKDGAITVAWAGTKKEYEDELFPIRVPILKGLLGHRIFIIRKGTQQMFDQVETLDDLRAIKLGQGKFWGDTTVLKHNRMSVVDPVKYPNLFYMLEGGRFDFFPRAVHEPWSEVAARPELNLTVENNILLIYPYAMYYFVAPENAKLGRYIEVGFRNAIDDGSFNEMFFSHPLIRDVLEKSDLQSRKVFRLSNPNMSPQTPFDEKKLWLDINNIEL
ncbi:hypothetical protein DS2_14929 [Catenovulum agarivorans DS-2]|uniref:Cyclic nucleotide-binding domain-containing protein n=2 Tax=Catenovulum agarivorans TaxID=1172192 RepID=W7QL97_9ALTE|nr:hypothetical protein DS2_14929 [Catenovulum agarivorans DS-2]